MIENGVRRDLAAAMRLVAIFAVFSAGGGPASASGSCPVHDWLRWIYIEGEGLQKAPGGTETEERALQLAHAIASAQSGRLTKVMEMAELEEGVPTVTAYLTALRARLMSRDWSSAAPMGPGPDDGLENPKSASMGDFIASLRCDADPAWTPDRPERKQQAKPPVPQNDLSPAPRNGAIVIAILLGMALFVLFVHFLARTVYEFFDRRRSIRHRCLIQASLHTMEGRQSAVAVDISRLGANLRLASEVALQNRCSLALGGLDIDCRITWSNQFFAGVAFSEAIDQAVFDRLIARHRWSAPSDDISSDEERRPEGAVPSEA
jgi:hypothetical protein